MDKENNKTLIVDRYFTKENVDPFDEVVWVKRTAEIKNTKGDYLFKQEDVEVPDFWSEMATNIVASKYFRGKLGTEKRESSVKQLIGRVVNTISKWGLEGKYFDEVNTNIFREELKYILLHQIAAFNSPVWFNVGYEEHPQSSACFINSIQDSMDSILDVAKIEGMIFKKGSGSGINLSPIRSSKESLRTGGIASGPVSFMRGLDSFAGVIKSGGATRRAACMRILNIDHPDIAEFIECKSKEEVKAQKLIAAGYDGSFNGEAYKTVQFQNANNSIRVTNSFMKAVIDDKDWELKSVTTGEVIETVNAKDLLMGAAKEAHFCGDPGIQYDTTINNWHTCPNSGKIQSSNPCSEYMFLDDTSCNLASLNLLKFVYEAYKFHIEMFKKAVRILITAQEILVGRSSYPTPQIEKNSHEFRPLGIGYANLGAMLMTLGLPYDSDGGRDLAAALTSLMSAEAYFRSAEIAETIGAFDGFETNKHEMLDVIENHWLENTHIRCIDNLVTKIQAEASKIWQNCYYKGLSKGIRNSQISVLAPTGTIGFMMDCDTTGVEPSIALVSYKKLAGAGDGILKLVNNSVEKALRNLNYSETRIKTIIEYITKNDTIEGCPDISKEHLPVFDCAFKPANGERSIHYKGHMKMCAAVQPFISGSISKTFNLPETATVQEIFDIYIESWKLGLKSVSVYRDNCKKSQPLSTKPHDQKVESKPLGLPTPIRKHLPDERPSITHKFSVAGHDGYMTVGLYEDGLPGEVFITISKEGSTISGLLNSLAESTSIALQYGVPLEVLINKFKHSRFEPSGWTNNKDIRMASSLVDYIFRWLEIKFVKKEGVLISNLVPPALNDLATVEYVNSQVTPPKKSIDTPLCTECGSLTTRNGTCYKCSNCGSTSGCS